MVCSRSLRICMNRGAPGLVKLPSGGPGGPGVARASEIAQGCVRVNGGPWLELRPMGRVWSGRLDLPFGPIVRTTMVTHPNRAPSCH